MFSVQTLLPSRGTGFLVEGQVKELGSVVVFS